MSHEPGPAGPEGEVIDPPPEYPIAFPADDLPALLGGRMTSFRRPVESSRRLSQLNRFRLYDFARAWADPGFPHGPDGTHRYHYLHVPSAHRDDADQLGTDGEICERVRCLFYPGDHLWVRETFRAIEDPGAPDDEVRRTWVDEDDETHYIVVDYKADAPTRIMDEMGKSGWKPPVCMPRWAARMILEVASIGVERAGSGGAWEWVVGFRRIAP